MSYNGAGNNNDIGKKIIVDRNKNVYVCGDTYGYGTEYDWTLIKYSQNVIGINNNSNYIPSDFQLYQNYPNPFNPKTLITYKIKFPYYVRLIVYDILGNEVQRLVDQFHQAGEYEVDFMGKNGASGVYFYRLEVDDNKSGKIFTETKKMLLLK